MLKHSAVKSCYHTITLQENKEVPFPSLDHCNTTEQKIQNQKEDVVIQCSAFSFHVVVYSYGKQMSLVFDRQTGEKLPEPKDLHQEGQLCDCSCLRKCLQPCSCLLVPAVLPTEHRHLILVNETEKTNCKGKMQWMDVTKCSNFIGW